MVWITVVMKGSGWKAEAFANHRKVLDIFERHKEVLSALFALSGRTWVHDDELVSPDGRVIYFYVAENDVILRVGVSDEKITLIVSPPGTEIARLLGRLQERAKRFGREVGVPHVYYREPVLELWKRKPHADIYVVKGLRQAVCIV